MTQSPKSSNRVNPTLLRPTYQNRLRVIGHHLDTNEYRDVAILEIDGGFIARATPRRGKRAQALEFPDTQFEQLMQGAVNYRGHGPTYDNRSSVLPTGYEDFLRGLGFLLDNQSAIAVTICELDQHVLITGQEPSDNVAGHEAFRRFERYLSGDDIQQLLDDAFNRRTGRPRRGGFLGIF
ncbi:MAG: hypothetical protein R3A46_16025 [Thermomicrobiales bacterium]